MEGRKNRKVRLLIAPVALVTLVLSVTTARADLLCVSPDSPRPSDRCRAEPYVALDGKVVMANLQREWQALREDLARSVVEATLTAFFIKSTPPPTGNPPPPGVTPPPPTGGGDVPPPPPPPPPDGQGDGVPPVNPPVDTPPSGTPEPTSLMLAALGAGFVSFCGWRRRRAKRDE